MKLRVFTDGSCSGNPGPGGWAAMFNYSDRMEEISGHELSTTNNRMELMAVAQALSNIIENGDALDYEAIEICSDSAYVVNAITKGWLEQWKSNGWRTKGGDAIKNCNLWKEIAANTDVIRKMVTLEFKKVKGHDGNLFNEMADARACEETAEAKRKLVEK